jgi:Na+/proline symporter
MALFLAVGTLLHLFYAGREGLDAVKPNDIFPKYIVEELPTGVRGLVMAGLLAAALSSFTSVLNALASTIIADFYRPFRARMGADASEAHFVGASRWATLVCGVVLMAAALAFQGSDQSVLDSALQVLGYFYGALLGAFLLGIFTRRGTSASVVAGMLLGVATVLLLQLRAFLAGPTLAPEIARRFIEAIPDPVASALRTGIPLVAWPWWIVAGALVTLAVGALGSARARAPDSLEVAAGLHGVPLR